jgi:hypothetical protein
MDTSDTDVCVLLDDLKEKIGYWKLKEEALDRTLWRTHFGKDCEHVRHTNEWMNDEDDGDD